MKVLAETLWQTDLFTKPVFTKKGIRQAYVLAFLHVNSRRVICSPAIFHPDNNWVVAQAENFLQEAEEEGLPVRFLVRDKDYKLTRRFDGVFEEADVSVERWIGSIKSECLNRFFVFGLKHLDHLVEEYICYYNELRPHSPKKDRPLMGVWQDHHNPPTNQEEIVCHQRLGSVLKHYQRQAA